MSIEVGIAVNAAICFVLSLFLWRRRPSPNQALLAFAMPYSVAFVLYWGLVMFDGGDPAGEFAMWAPLFIVFWGTPSYISVLVAWLIRKKLTK